jgi:hypothetical protein
LALALAVGFASAQALPAFTFDPDAVGLDGAEFTADNIITSDYAVVKFSGSTFTQEGYLSVAAFQLANSTIAPAGLNTDYGMYVKFTSAGTFTSAAPGLISAQFSSISYTLYGYNGTATFGFTGETPMETATGEIALATGSLIPGTGFAWTTPAGPGKISPGATAELTFNPEASAAGFFKEPNPFYGRALTAFINTSSQVEQTADGFLIRQGGGVLNLAPIPEPGTYAMLLSGLAAVGFIARRRRPS